MSVCVGAALVHLLGGWPLRTLLWDEGLWTRPAAILGYDWKDWVSSAWVDSRIDAIGIFFSLALVAVPMLAARWRQVVWIAFFILLIRHFLLFKDHFYLVGQLLEYCLQTLTPIIWLLYFKKSKWGALAVGAVSVTFIGHGLFALGYHPVPEGFVTMTMQGLSVSDATAREILLVVGILDMIAAVFILVPATRKLALLWIIPWAVLTTLARIWSYGSIVSLETLVWQWGPELVVRLPHILVPLALCYAWSAPRPQATNEQKLIT